MRAADRRLWSDAAAVASAVAGAVAVAALLSGCLATPAGPGSQGFAPADATGAKATAPVTAAAPQAAAGSERLMPREPAPAGSKPATAAQLFDLQRAELDLMRPDGSACRAVSDGGTGSNLALMGQISLTLLLGRFTESQQFNMASLQTSLDSLKTPLRQLSKQVVWLPLEAEAAVGAHYLRLGEFPPWQAVNPAQRRFVEQTLQPMFEQLARYAREELAAPQPFAMQLFADARRVSPEMIPGGRLMVPSGMIALLTAERDRSRAEQLLAFQLAHEFSHALRRHTTKEIQTKLVDGLMVAQVFSKNFKGTGQQFKSLQAANIGQIFNLSAQGVGQILGAVCATEQLYTAFDQTQELEADTCGALLLDKLSQVRGTAFDPVVGYLGYRQLMTERMGSSAAPTGGAANARFCVSAARHPDPAARESNLRRYWTQLKAQPRADRQDGVPLGKGPRGDRAP